MVQLKLILLRLKNPSVILSIISQVTALLLLFHIKLDESIVIGVATAVCSILTTLGILSNPSSKNKGYGDDIYVCKNCGRKSVHVFVKGQMVCCDCGCVKTD